MPINDAVLAQARDAAFDANIHYVKDAGGIRGPALVYTAWNGRACGTMHDLNAIVRASRALHIPLYVIQSIPLDQPLGNDKPGYRVNRPGSDGAAFNEMLENLDYYGLAMQSSLVRFVGANGEVQGPPVASRGGNIENTFRPLLGQQRRAEVGGRHAA